MTRTSLDHTETATESETKHRPQSLHTQSHRWANRTHTESFVILVKILSHPLQPWSPARNEGNPTKSQEINDLIARVKKKEVHWQGIPSRAHCPVTESKYWQQQTILRSQVSRKWQSHSVLWHTGYVQLPSPHAKSDWLCLPMAEREFSATWWYSQFCSRC